MRKSWLTAGTILAGFVASLPAHAQNMEMTFSGSLDYQFQFADQDQPSAGTGINLTAVADQSELIWDARATADNGLQYGASIEWRFASNGGNGGGTFDEAYLMFGGGWGTLQVGSVDDPVDEMATGGNDVQAHSEGFDGEFGNVYTQIGDAGFLGTEASSDDANKIAYYTPNFGGFEAGFAFTPESNVSLQSQGTDTSTATNILESSLAYGVELGDVAVTASLGYRHANADDNTSGSDVEDVNAWRTGVKVGFGPIELGAGYGYNGDSACQKGTQCDAGENVQLGLGWDYGAGRFAIGYATGWETNNDGTEDSIDVYNISMDYTVTEGLIAYGDLVHARSDNGTAGAANENEGTVLLVGTAVFF